MVTLVALVVHNANGIGWLPTSSIGSPGSPPLPRVRRHVWRRHLCPRARGSHYVQRTSNLLACGQPASAASAPRFPLVHTCVDLTTTSTVALVALVMHSTNEIRWLAASPIGSLGSPPLAHLWWCVWRRHLCCHTCGSHCAQRKWDRLASQQLDRQPRLTASGSCAVTCIAAPVALTCTARIKSTGLPDRQPCVRWCVLRHHRCCHVRGAHLAQRASNPLARGQVDRQPRLNGLRWCALTWFSLPPLLPRS